MKKLVALFLTLALALTGVAALAEEFTVYLITMDLMDQHWVNVDAGAKAAVEELGKEGITLKLVPERLRGETAAGTGDSGTNGMMGLVVTWNSCGHGANTTATNGLAKPRS